jgi:creatinine amidohydrolase
MVREGMKNMIKNVMEMTWVEIQELDKEKTALFVTIAPIEEHSHHLPLGTDIYEGERWRNDLLEHLAQQLPEYNLLYVPPVPIACASAAGFYGNIHFKQSTVKNIAYELLENIVVIASHGDPSHLIAIEEACTKINKKYGTCSFTPMGALFSANELGIDVKYPNQLKEVLEKCPNYFHAGWIETSNMMDIDNSLVKSNYHDLPDIEIKETEMISAKKTLVKMGNYGHLGYPRMASQELGKLLNLNLSQNLAEVVLRFIKREQYEQYQHHSLYKIPFLRTNFHRNLMLGLIVVFAIVVGILIFI